MNICLTKYVQSELDEDDGGVVCESKCTEVTKKREEEKKKSRCALSVLRLVAATSCT